MNSRRHQDLDHDEMCDTGGARTFHAEGSAMDEETPCHKTYLKVGEPAASGRTGGSTTSFPLLASWASVRDLKLNAICKRHLKFAYSHSKTTQYKRFARIVPNTDK